MAYNNPNIYGNNYSTHTQTTIVNGTTYTQNTTMIGNSSCSSSPTYCDSYSIYTPCLQQFGRGDEMCFQFYVLDKNGDIVPSSNIEHLLINLNNQFGCNILTASTDCDSDGVCINFSDEHENGILFEDYFDGLIDVNNDDCVINKTIQFDSEKYTNTHNCAVSLDLLNGDSILKIGDDKSTGFLTLKELSNKAGDLTISIDVLVYDLYANSDSDSDKNTSVDIRVLVNGISKTKTIDECYDFNKLVFEFENVKENAIVEIQTVYNGTVNYCYIQSITIEGTTYIQNEGLIEFCVDGDTTMNFIKGQITANANAVIDNKIVTIPCIQIGKVR